MSTEHNELESFIERLPLGVLVLNAHLQLRICNELSMKLLNVDVETLLSVPFMEAIKDFAPMTIALHNALSGASQKQRIMLFKKEITLSCTVLKTTDSLNNAEVIVLIEDATSVTKIEQLEREFISSLLHKLRSPLSTIRTSLSLLHDGSQQIGPQSAQETKEIFGMCYEEVNRLNLLINDMRDLFLIETKLAGKELEFEDFPIGSALARAIAKLEKYLPPQLTNHRISVIGDEELVVRADFEKTKMVLFILLKNALHYSGALAPVEVTCAQANGYAEIRIKDQGIGIGEEHTALVFSKYFREDNETTRNSTGNGLGLFIAKSYIELMKGTIYFESKRSAGTTFSVMLPLTQG